MAQSATKKELKRRLEQISDKKDGITAFVDKLSEAESIEVCSALMQVDIGMSRVVQETVAVLGNLGDLLERIKEYRQDLGSQNP